ncbi:MAG: hypothetical protein H0Z31_06705 [Bacillus sp. (in: Bacteria)]|nr:hypothetical protein [Bacillus sp. (in: firmicutes)]
MEELKSRYKELNQKSDNLKQASISLISEFYNLSSSFEEAGNLYLSAESLKRAALMQKELRAVDEVEIRTAAVYFEEASMKYYSINYYGDAAKCVQEAATIYLEIKDYKQAYKCYGLAKNYYGDSGDYDNCGRAYFNEMDYKRIYYLNLLRSSKKNWFPSLVKYLKYEIFKVTTNYGESIFRLIVNSTFIILFFSLIYFLLQDVKIPDNNSENNFYETPSYSLEYFILCLKFSLSLFSGYSTTPYLLNKYNFLTSIEVLLGNLMLALFIAIVLRKVSRR